MTEKVINGYKFTGPDLATIEAEARKFFARFEKPEATFGEGVLQGYGERVLDTPRSLLEFGGRAVKGAANLGRAAVGRPMQPVPPEGMFGGLLPTGRQVLSGAQAGVSGLLSGDPTSIPDRYGQAVSRAEDIEKAAPQATGLGGIMGEASQMAMGRLPFVKGPGGALDAPIADALKRARGALKRLAPQSAVRKDVNEFLKSDFIKKLARGAGRSVEAGMEGAALTILNGGDPLEVGAWTAGTQAVSSLGLDTVSRLTKGEFKSAVLNMTIYALAAGGAWQLAKSLIPGGKDYILESTESGFNKVAFPLAIGLVAGIVGKRPEGKSFVGKEHPKIRDAMNTAFRRGPMTAAIRNMLEDENTATVMQKVQTHPDSFAQYSEALGKAFEGESLKDAIDDLMEKDKKFRELVTGPDPRLAGVPEK